MSKQIPRNVIDDLINRCDLVELIEARIPLKKRGKNYLALCPFHAENSPSFNVNPVKQFYYCFGCGASGNAISFLMDYDKLDFVSAVELLAQRLGVTISYQENTSPNQKRAADYYTVLGNLAQFYQQQLRKPQYKMAQTYLEKRGISPQMLDEFGIGYAPNQWDAAKNLFPDAKNALLETGMLIERDDQSVYDRFRHRIMFPIRDLRGRVIAFGGRSIDPEDQPKYLNSPETICFHKSRVLYGLYEARKSNRDLKSLIVVEGYMDVVTLSQFGFRNAVATMGTAISDDHLQQVFRTVSEVIFCFDGDSAGHKAAWRSLELLLSHLHEGVQAKFLFLPEEHDPDSYLKALGQEAFQQEIQRAMPFSDYLFSALEKEVDLSHVDGRAALVSRAKPYLEKLAPGVLRDMLEKELASRARIAPDILRERFHGKPKLTRVQPKNDQQKNRLSLLRVASALLVQNPALLHEVSMESLKYIWMLNVPGIDLLKELVAYLQANPAMTTGLLLEHYRDKPEYDLIKKLALFTHPVPETGWAEEVKGALTQLDRLGRELLIEALMQQASAQTLSAEQRQTLQALLIER